MTGKPFRLLASSIILFTLIGTAVTPAQAAGVTAVHILGADYISGKGLVLYFEVSVDFNLEAAEKLVIVNGIRFPLACQFKDNGLLVCVAGVKKTAIGSLASIFIGDASFESTIPEPNMPVVPVVNVCTGYEYNVYDYGPPTPEIIPWGLIGTYTQPCPATVGDVIEFYNANWDGFQFYDGFFDYTYSLDGNDVCAPDLGNGYYFEDCFG